MRPRMDIEAGALPSWIVALAMFGLSGWILWLNFGSRIHRAFALFLVLRGTLSVLLAMGAADPLDYYTRVLGYLVIAIPFAALYLGAVAWTDRGPGRRSSVLAGRALPVALLASLAVFEFSYAFDHGLFYRVTNGILSPGPYLLFYDLAFAAYALVALVLGSAYVMMPRSGRTSVLFVVSLAFAIEPMYQMTFILLGAPGPIGADPVFVASYWIEVGTVAAVVGLAVLFIVASGVRGDGTLARGGARFLAVLVAAALAAAVVQWVSRIVPAERFLLTHSWVSAVAHLALVGMMVYAIVRHRFLEADVRVRSGLSHGVVASAFVATFFVFTEGLATFISALSSPYVGILATGSLIFALAPLRRFGDRVARAAMPDAVPVEERTLDERVTLFAEQTRIAWEDGVLTAKERRMLDSARERMGLSEGQAARIERKVLEEKYPTRRRRVRAVADPDRWAVRP